MTDQTRATRLTQQDVEHLLHDPSGATRVETAGKVASVFAEGQLTPAERAIGEEIFRIMVQDAEVRVRKALSQHLRKCADLPHDVALSLARDVDAVAIPILESSHVLTEEDLVELVTAHGTGGQRAIARRDDVTAKLAEALVESGTEEVVATLAANKRADLTEPVLDKAIARHGDATMVQEALVHRSRLPVVIAEKLVARVSDHLRDYLVTHHELPAAMAADLVHASRERATMSLLPPGMDEGVDLERLVEQLHVNRRLTPTLVLRSLCLGDISFFEAALARLARVPLNNVRKLVHDGGLLGFRAVYERAKLPEDLYAVFRIAFAMALATEAERGDEERPKFVRRVLERILTSGETLGDADVEYLLRKLDEFS